MIKTGLKLAGPIIRGIKGISGKVKAKVAAGKAWVKGKAAAVTAKVFGGHDDSPAGKQKRLDAARSALRAALLKGVKGVRLRLLIGALELKHGMKDLRVEPLGDRKVKFVGEINPVFEEFAEAIPVVDKTKSSTTARSCKRVPIAELARAGQNEQWT